MLVSVIFPTAADKDCEFLRRSLATLKAFPEVEVICVSEKESPCRAERLNLGVRRSKGSVLLLNHPRSCIEPEGLQHLVDLYRSSDRPAWGCFTHQFDQYHPLLKFTSWYSNKVRLRFAKIAYLDHCIFMQRKLWTRDLPKVEIFEDTLLSYNLRKFGRPVLLPFKSTTSSIRFQKNGVFRQALMNQVLKAGFHLGIPATFMNRIYEKGLELNS